MGKSISMIMVIFALVGASFAVNVSVSSPYNSATVGLNTTITASASGSYPITGWRVYIDGNNVYSTGATQAISAPVSMASGSHQVIVRAWDSTGAYGSYNLQLNASQSVPSTTTGVTVNVTSPGANTTVSSPVTLAASASSGTPITGWRVYVDGNNVYSAGATSGISAPLSMGTGTHQVVVRAWNSKGTYGDRALQLTVGSSSNTSTGGTATSSAGPNPPSNAIAFKNVDQMTGWGSCATAACSGSSAAASYWVALNQTNPSRDGSSAHFYVSGSPWADVLWYKSLGSAANNATHFLLDYWIYPTTDTLTHTEALEFDFVQSVNGRKWDFSNECHYSGQHWDTWDGQNLKWIHTTVPCPKLAANQWHHIKIYAERVGTQTHNISYTVDNTTYQVPTQYAYHNTQGTNWANSINVQVQMDINANAGTSSEYIDQMTLYAW